MKQDAAIKRASRQARNAMYELDAATAKQLFQEYEWAAAEVRARLNAAADPDESVPQHRLRQLLQQLDAVIDALGARVREILDKAIDSAVKLGIWPFTMEGVLAVGGSDAVLTSTDFWRVHERAVSFVSNLAQDDGLTLSDRLWRLDRGAKEALTRAVGMSIVQGHSATSAAMEFVMRNEPVPVDVARRWAGRRLPALLRGAELLVNAKGGDGYWQAERVMRTEINRAHGEAFMAAGEETPGFGGWRYLLSPMHPAPDICDLLSTQNLHGLGPGVYPNRESTPWPAHPNTLSFLEIVFKDEITDADRAGKETSMQALQRLAPEIRAGALGKTKAEYFDRGLLRTGMIRAPLHAIDQRLRRQGRL